MKGGKDWYKASATEQKEREGEGGRGGQEGIKCKKDRRRGKKGEKDAQELHQFLSARNKKHCVREWERVSSGTRRVQ